MILKWYSILGYLAEIEMEQLSRKRSHIAYGLSVLLVESSLLETQVSRPQVLNISTYASLCYNIDCLCFI